MALESNGNITSDVPTKFQNDQNIWFICDAPNASYSVPMEELEAFSIDDLVAEVKAKILERSSGGIKGIARIFKAMDDNGNRQLDVEDFRWGFIDYGFNLTQEEAQHLVTHFDRDGNGTVSYDEFLRALKVSKHENGRRSNTSKLTAAMICLIFSFARYRGNLTRHARSGSRPPMTNWM